MNIFYTNECPVQSANEHVRVHQVKMIVEYAQLLSSAHHELDGDNAIGGIYKKTHVNHPSAVWLRKSYNHYVWVWECAKQLCALYTERTGKIHKTESILDLLAVTPVNIPEHGFTNPPVAAPDEFKALAVFGDTCKAYQKYLCSKFDEWQSRAKPIKVEFDIVPDWYCVN
ncbi:DNA binding protein [Vibrio phage K375]|nr:hypothetical protein MYOV072v1_p0055 [Vibrio phage 207E29.1]